MITKDSANGVLRDIAGANAAVANNIGVVLLNNYKLGQAETTLQGLGTLGVHGGEGPFYSVERSSFLTEGIVKQRHRITPKEGADSAAQEPRGRKANTKKNKRFKATKRSVPKAAAGAALGKKSKRMCKSDDVLDGGRRDVAEHTRRTADDDADEGFYEQ